MLSTLSATEMAFLQIAVMQAVAACLWGVGAWLARAERLALGHWAAYAALSALTWSLLGLHLDSPPPAVALIGVCAVVALRRGIRLFIGRPFGWTAPALALASVLAAGLLGEAPEWRPLQAAVNFGVVSALYLATALDLRRHARDDLHWRFPLLLSLPVLLGALAFASRALRALLDPASVLGQMNAHSAFNIGSALSYIVLVLLMHAMLTGLVVTRLLSQLQRLARRDPLTGLLNRRGMHVALESHAQRRRRAADRFSVLMIDIDHFKAVNDRHGHDIGDRALAHVARLMVQALGPADLPGRFGGEEFVVLLPAASLQRAQAQAERLCQRVRSEPLGLDSGPLALSVSIGVAEWDGPDEDVARLLARADAALYLAKRQGRDRVETSPGAGAATELQRS